MFFNETVQRPINTYAARKYWMLAILMVFGVIYALPNIYGEDYAVQVTGAKGAEISQSTFESVKTVVETAEIKIKQAEFEQGKALIRFFDSESQLKAKDLIADKLNQKSELSIALNLAPSTPEWLKNLGGNPLKLGLDLRGGVHFLMQVDMDSAVGKMEKQYIADLKTKFREENLRYTSVSSQKDPGIVAKFRDAETADKAEVAVRTGFQELQTRIRTDGEFSELVVTISQTKLRDIKDYAVKQNIAIFRNRINELGVAEPLIQQQGSERILVQLPGVQDSAQAKRILGATATIEFRLTDDGAGLNPSRAPAGTELLEEAGRGVHAVRKNVIVDGTHLTDASVGFDERGLPQINVKLDGEGGSKMLAVTRKNVGKPMAIVMIENKGIYRQVDGEQQLIGTKVLKKVVSAPNIQSALGKSFRITGQFSPTEAHELALILRSGSLIAPAYIVEERTVGPSLGQQNIELGKTSVVAGFLLVLVFMAVYYRVFGLVANIALVSNLVFIIAIMSLVPGATLTLPGIAGIVLTVGMAVDANVLIYERIREEMRDGVKPAQAIHNGYDKAFSTIADANITTLIAALVLFSIGTGPIAGFAVTLFIGIMTSMFTAIVGSRALVNLIYGGKQLKKISI